MSASPSLLDEIFELLGLATHLEDSKENRVEAATKVRVTETASSSQLPAFCNRGSDFGVISQETAVLNAIHDLTLSEQIRSHSFPFLDTISFTSFLCSLLSSILLHTYCTNQLLEKQVL